MVNTALIRRGFIPFTLLTVIFSAFSGAFLSSGTFTGSDFVQIHYPQLQFVVRNLMEGTIPLWNPHQFLGYSVVGNPQYGLFYPPNWLLLFFGEDGIAKGVSLIVVLHIFWAALGLAVVCRQWGSNAVGAIVAGVSFGLGGFMLSRVYIGHYAIILSAAWLPWIIAGYYAALQKRTVQSVIPGALALGFSILAGHPQVIYLTTLALIIMWLSTSSRSTLWLSLRQLVLLGILGAALGAVVLLPVFDYSDQTLRGSETSLTFANAHAVPARQLLDVVVADAFGHPAQGEYWGAEFYEEMTAYTSLLAILMAMIVPWRRYRFFIALVLFGLWFSVGRDGVLYELLYYLIPPARTFRAPGRALMLTSLGLSALLGIGISHLEYASLTLKRRLVISLLAMGILLIGWRLVMPVDWTPTDEALRWQRDQLNTSLLLLVLISAGFMWWWSGYRQIAMLWLISIFFADIIFYTLPRIDYNTYASSPVWEAAEMILPEDSYGRVMQMPPPPGIVNGASTIGSYSSQGYDPLSPVGWHKLQAATGPFIFEPGGAVNRVFGVEYAISNRLLDDYGIATASVFEQIGESGDYRFYQNPNPLPRVYLVNEYVVEPDEDRARARVTGGEVDQGQFVVLDAEPHCDVEDGNGKAFIKAYAPNRVSLKIETDAPMLLVLLDQYDKDWHASISGSDVNIFKANSTFRAICVPSGEHTVLFIYQPQAFYIGAGISFLAFAAVFGGLFIKRYN